MTTRPGTFELVALELERALQPLARRAEAGEFLLLLGDLGLDVPPGASTAQLQTAFRTLAEGAAVLPELANELKSAIAADDSTAMITRAVAIAAQSAAIVEAIVSLGTAVSSLTLSTSAEDLTTFVTELPRNLFQQVLVEHLQGYFPKTHAALQLFGLVETELHRAGTGPDAMEFHRKRLRLDRLGTLLTDPEVLVNDLYGWGDSDLDANLFVQRLAGVLRSLGLPVAQRRLDDGRWALEVFLFSLMGTEGVDPPGLQASVMLEIAEGIEGTLPLGGGFELGLSARASIGASAGVQLLPPATIELIPPEGQIQGSAAATLFRVPVAPDASLVLLGAAGGSGLFADKIGLGLNAGFNWSTSASAASGDVGFQGRIEGGKLVISGEGADGFIAELLSGIAMEAAFELGFGWSAGDGVFFEGSGALQIRLPAHIDLGPVQLNGLTMSVGIDGGSFPVGLGVDVAAQLGPLAVTIERIGAAIDISFPSGGDGNLGPLQLDFGFQPPAGAGLSIDAGVVRGGGYLFFDYEGGEYAGALELDIAGIVTVAAIGLITTKMPDGKPGASVLVVITAEFGSGIQLGYGFTLLGVGGIVGIHRRMALDALVEGVRTGAIDRVMFPTNIVQNITQILNDLRAYFPVQRDKFLIGPLAKLGWGTPTLVSVSLGVVIEIPGNIAILGVLKVALPHEDAAILVLQVSFIGAIEFDKDRLWFFASLFGSRVLFITIEGDMGLLIAWGNQPEFVISVGGFHPAFQPPPMPFPVPRRVAVSILDESWGRIRVTGYFAVTSNSAQFGAGLELFFGFSGLSISGHLAFDALFIFSPFYFIIGISGSLSLKVVGISLLSVRLEFSLEGPTPWRAKGSGSVKILFFKIKANFDFTWGEERQTTLPPIAVMPILVDELNKLDNWQSALPAASSLSVALRPLEDTAALRLHPVGTLRVSQRAVPLEIHVDKVGNQSASDAHVFSLAPKGTDFERKSKTTESFAIGQFQELGNDEKLSRKSFEPETSGLELSSRGEGMSASRAVTRTLRYEQVILDNHLTRFKLLFVGLARTLFSFFLGRNAAALAEVSQAAKLKLKPLDESIAVAPDEFVVASTMDNTPFSQASAFSSQAQAQLHLQQQLANDPSLRGTLHVIEGHELQEAA